MLCRAIMLAALVPLSCLLPNVAQAVRPSRNYYDTPHHLCGVLGIAVEDVDFRTADGLRLTGWFFSRADSAHPRRSTVIIAGPDGGNMGDLLFYTGMVNIGMNVLLFDYRGFGKSDPWAIDSTALLCREFALDLEAAIRYVKTRADVDTSNLGLFGLSMGAVLCAGAAAAHPEVRALAVEGIATSTDDVIAVLRKVKGSALSLPGGYPTAAEPINAFPRLKSCAVLVIAAERDTHTPVWMAKKLYNAAPGKRSLWVIPGATHGGGPQAIDHRIYTEKVNKFFDAALSKWEYNGKRLPGFRGW